jgi:hypothetical protein
MSQTSPTGSSNPFVLVGSQLNKRISSRSQRTLSYEFVSSLDNCFKAVSAWTTNAVNRPRDAHLETPPSAAARPKRNGRESPVAPHIFDSEPLGSASS